MKNQINAAISIAVLSVMPFVFVFASVIQALVVLRKGVKESTLVLVLSGLPSLVVWVFLGDVTYLFLLICAALLGYVLRITVSWSKLLLVAMLLAVLNVFLLPLLMSDSLLFIVKGVQTYLAQSSAEEVKQFLNRFGIRDASEQSLFQYLVAAVAVGQMCLVIVAVFFARLWQSKLYNPGGLRKEMWQLKLPVSIALTVVCMKILGENLGDSIQFLAEIAIPVIVMVGLALVHGVCAKIQNGKICLITFYVIGMMVLGIYIVNILMIAILIDSFIDIRSRLPSNKSDLNKS